VVNEAMAAGLPVIVSNRCGCAEDLVDPARNGFVFDPGTLGDLARCLRQMEDATPGDLAQMGARSSDIIGRYSPSAFGEQVAVIAQAGVGLPVNSYS
jgi:glycosyltransferase involved in cell wall biosynthesis